MTLDYHGQDDRRCLGHGSAVGSRGSSNRNVGPAGGWTTGAAQSGSFLGCGYLVRPLGPTPGQSPHQRPHPRTAPREVHDDPDQLRPHVRGQAANGAARAAAAEAEEPGERVRASHNPGERPAKAATRAGSSKLSGQAPAKNPKP